MVSYEWDFSYVRITPEILRCSANSGSFRIQVMCQALYEDFLNTTTSSNWVSPKNPWHAGWLVNPINTSKRTDGVWVFLAEPCIRRDYHLSDVHFREGGTFPPGSRKIKITPQDLCQAKDYIPWGANYKLEGHKHFTQPLLQSKYFTYFSHVLMSDFYFWASSW